MIKQKTILEVAKDERLYQLEVQPDSPLGEIYDILNQMRQYIISRIEEENKKQEKEAEKAREEVKGKVSEIEAEIVEI